MWVPPREEWGWGFCPSMLLLSFIPATSSFMPMPHPYPQVSQSYEEAGEVGVNGLSKGPVIQVSRLEDRCAGNLLGTLHLAAPPTLCCPECWPYKRSRAGDDDSGVLEKAKGH